MAVGKEVILSSSSDERHILVLKRARLLACLLDFLLCAGCADAVALAVTALLWWLLPGARAAIPWVWAAAAAGALAGFTTRDSRGGRARRWLGLEAVREDGTVPGTRASVRRNLPLLVPIWNVLEAWPVLKDGEATRPADRKTRIRIRRTG
jgi:hypothetical protein